MNIADQMTIGVSIIIPCFNEADRITPTVQAIVEYFRRGSTPLELIFVDDGSTDSTKAVIQQLCECTVNPAGFQSRLFSLEPNRGKGAAIKEGFLAASREVVLLCDADLSCPIEEVAKFMADSK